MILNGFFQQVLMLPRVIALHYLHLFLYHREKISRCASFASSVFLRWFLPSLQAELRTLLNCCENQSKKILFVISERLLAENTGQYESQAIFFFFLRNCKLNLPAHKQSDKK